MGLICHTQRFVGMNHPLLLTPTHLGQLATGAFSRGFWRTAQHLKLRRADPELRREVTPAPLVSCWEFSFSRVGKISRAGGLSQPKGDGDWEF